jgi:hypothetical protein
MTLGPPVMCRKARCSFSCQSSHRPVIQGFFFLLLPAPELRRWNPDVIALDTVEPVRVLRFREVKVSVRCVNVPKFSVLYVV